jgi:glycosyltransferase involved in cell wall biosynthesis
MRVLHIGTEMRWRGGESQISYLMEGLKQSGVDNFFAYPKGSAAIERLSPEFQFLELASRSGYDPRSILRLVRFCRQLRIDLLDAHSADAHALAVAAKFWLPNLKVVVHRHVDNAIRQRWSTRKKYLSPRVDRYIAISTAIRNILANFGVSKSKISVVKSATDTERFNDRNRSEIKLQMLARLGLPKSTFLFGNASALTDQKGYEVLLAAVKIIDGKNAKVAPSFHCLIAGEGKLRLDLERLVDQLQIRHRVTFLGFVSDVSSVLLALDILTVPSNYEGLGTVILEGILCGCPVIATEVGGIPEIIKNGVTGLLVAKGDSQKLAECILRLMVSEIESASASHHGKEFEDLHVDAAVREAAAVKAGEHGLGERLNRAAQELVRAEFSKNCLVEGNLKVYRELLAEGK